MLHAVFALSLLIHILIVVTAIGVGGRAERLGGWLLAATALTTLLVQNRRYDDADLGLLLIDVVQLIAFFVIARITGRRWPLVASALTLSGVFVHGAMIIHGAVVNAFPYLTLYALISYLVLISLAAGTISAVRRRRASQV